MTSLSPYARGVYMFRVLRHVCPFLRNEYGHILFTLEGAGLSGRAEFDLLQRKYSVGTSEEDLERCLTSGEYDAKHRLVARRQYRVALVPHSVIAKQDERTSEALTKLAVERFGYWTPPAGVIPVLRWKIQNWRLWTKDMGYYYVVAHHEPIGERVLYLSSYVGEEVCARKVTPPDAFSPHWNAQGAAAFLCD
jgi:hypothetical protein